MKYFLRDNENAVKIQIYCVFYNEPFIDGGKKETQVEMGFFKPCQFLQNPPFQLHQIDVFLKNPLKDWIVVKKEYEQLSLF